MWKRFAPRDAIGKAFQLKYAVKEYFLRHKNYFVIEKTCSS